MLYVVGDVHGRLREMYSNLPAGPHDKVLQVGDLGCWPYPERADRQTVRHDSVGDLKQLVNEKFEAPFPVWFCKGNHEDFDYLSEIEAAGPKLDPPWSNMPRVASDMFHCPNGTVCGFTLGYTTRKLSSTVWSGTQQTCQVGFVGGSYAPSKFNRPSRRATQGARRHFYRDEMEQVIERGPVDILVMHEALDYDGNVREIDMIKQIGPKIVFSGHQHVFREKTIDGIRFVQLAMIGRPNWWASVDVNLNVTLGG